MIECSKFESTEIAAVRVDCLRAKILASPTDEKCCL